MGCPLCGSERLKAAPLALSAGAALATGRRRYKCADCGWTGWKHRLKRRTQDGGLTLQQRESPDAKAVIFFVIVLMFLAITTVLLLRSCESAPPDVVSTAVQ